MMKITEFNKSSISSFEKEFEKSMEALGKKLGVHIEMGNGTFSSAKLSTKITVMPIKEGENPEEVKGKNSLKVYGRKYGLSEKDYGRGIITGPRSTGKIVGIAPKAYKFPILIEEKGEIYGYPYSILEK